MILFVIDAVLWSMCRSTELLAMAVGLSAWPLLSMAILEVPYKHTLALSFAVRFICQTSQVARHTVDFNDEIVNEVPCTLHPSSQD